MSELQSLGYVGVTSQKLEDWRAFGTDLLGMQVLDRSAHSLALRMDDRQHRLIIDAGNEEGCRFFGWEVADAAALNRLAATLEAASVAVQWGTQALADQRCVRALIRFADPAGNILEAYYGGAIASDPFRPGRSISGFRTGPLGLGHVVLTTDNIAALLPFYQDVLGFAVSDYTLRPFRAWFLHVSPRHHTLAMVETGRNGVHHVMVELFSLDDVGQGYDIAQTVPGRVGVTLGRHTNDLMTSFYARTPSGFMMEYGWGGRDIDPATWQPFECDYGPSLWGHERDWLTPEKQAEARALRMEAAARGIRETVRVLPGNHEVMQGACPWWDRARQSAA